jgi:hypothetical protein
MLRIRYCFLAYETSTLLSVYTLSTDCSYMNILNIVRDVFLSFEKRPCGFCEGRSRDNCEPHPLYGETVFRMHGCNLKGAYILQRTNIG